MDKHKSKTDGLSRQDYGALTFSPFQLQWQLAGTSSARNNIQRTIHLVIYLLHIVLSEHAKLKEQFDYLQGNQPTGIYTI